MDHDQAPLQQPSQAGAPPFWRSRYALGLIVFSAVAAYFVLSEHRAHFFGALPFLLLLACALMHMFMHGGHGGHGGGKPGAHTPKHTPEPKTGAQP